MPSKREPTLRWKTVWRNFLKYMGVDTMREGAVMPSDEREQRLSEREGRQFKDCPFCEGECKGHFTTMDNVAEAMAYHEAQPTLCHRLAQTLHCAAMDTDVEKAVKEVQAERDALREAVRKCLLAFGAAILSGQTNHMPTFTKLMIEAKEAIDTALAQERAASKIPRSISRKTDR